MQLFPSRPFDRLAVAALALSFLVAAGCTGTASDDGDNPGDDGAGGSGDTGGNGGGSGGGIIPPDGPTGFACDPKAAPPATAMRRLTATQYRNTIRDLLKMSVGDKGDPIFTSLTKAFSTYPADSRPSVPKDKHGAYRRMDQDVQDLHVEGSFRVAFSIAEQVTKPDALGALMGACATDSNAGNDAECVSKFVSDFGSRAFRRPLDDGEKEFFRGFYGDVKNIDAKAVANVVAGILMAPRFLYIVEHGADPVAGKEQVFALDDYELASRLSYQFWQTMPDAELYQAAASGDLRKPETLQAQVDRLLKDSRAQGTFDEFYADYLKVDDLPFLDKSEEFKYRAFAGGDLPNPATRGNVINDTLTMTRYLTWKQKAKWDDLMLDEHNFATTEDVARLYGVSKWSGNGEPPKFSAGERPGLLTRIAALATGMVVTRPIMKGVAIRQNLLCDEIPPPPANAQSTRIDQGPSSTRDMTIKVTEGKGTACAGCHSTLINPLGFVFEGYDSLGRKRDKERFYDGGTGLVSNTWPIKTNAVPRVTEEDEREAKGPGDLAKYIVESKKGPACFARHVFRFSFARWETLEENVPAAVDGCVLDRLRKVAEDKPLQDVFREVALAPEFQQRTIKP